MKQILMPTILLLSIIGHSQDFKKELIERLDAQIEEYVEGISPGIAAGIVKDGETVYQKYIGYSNLENEIAISQNTRFNIASNAKQFTALNILKLVEDGKISLDDDIRKFLPKLFKNIAQQITISHLLTHTSGIRDVYDLWALKGQTWWKLFIDNEDAMELLTAQTDLNFPAGTQYQYSNSNYILLTTIVEVIEKQNFSEMARLTFAELEMSNTNFRTNYMEVIPNRARPYGNWSGWREYPSITETHGDGALFTTLTDQLQWEKIIQQNNGKYLSKALIKKSQTKIGTPDSINYGYGLEFGRYKGLNYTYHNGNTGAYNATFLRFYDYNVSIVVISNNGDVPTNYLAKQLADIALDLKENDAIIYPASPDTIEKLKDIQDVVGNYENDDGTVIQITEKEGSLYREIYQREPVKLIREKEGLFHYETNPDLKMNFINISSAKQEFTLYLSSQEPSTFYKRPKINLDKTELNGSFYNDETNTEIIIKYVKDNSYMITKNGRKRQANLILNDYLRMMSSYEIKIIRNDQNDIVGLNVKTGRIKNVIFDKL